MEERDVIIIGGGPVGIFPALDGWSTLLLEGRWKGGQAAGCIKHFINCAGQGAEAGMAVSEYLAGQLVKAGKIFKGAKNGKYADEYLKELNQSS